jgi:hypothetical protein
MLRANSKTAGRITAWVAAAAVALNALWPLIAQLNPTAAAMHLEDCAELGLHHHEQGELGASSPKPPPLSPNCSFCSLVTGGFVVLVAARHDAAPLVIGMREFRPEPPPARHAASFPYSLAHPRAPPALS